MLHGPDKDSKHSFLTKNNNILWEPIYSVHGRDQRQRGSVHQVHGNLFIKSMV